MSDHKTGEWMDCTIAAKPASKKARHPYATVTAVFYVSDMDFPSRGVADRIVNAPVLLDAAERRLAAVESERDAAKAEIVKLRDLCSRASGMIDTVDGAAYILSERLRVAGDD